MENSTLNEQLNEIQGPNLGHDCIRALITIRFWLTTGLKLITRNLNHRFNLTIGQQFTNVPLLVSQYPPIYAYLINPPQTLKSYIIATSQFIFPCAVSLCRLLPKQLGCSGTGHHPYSCNIGSSDHGSNI